jgi:GNAT superfamily N-acetyltransferase
MEEQRRLFVLAFPEHIGKLPETIEFYDWKFRSLPSVPSSYEYVASDGSGRIVGYYAALPYPYLLDGISCTVGMVCDVMTHPDSRGGGVFTRLGHYALNALEAAGIPLVMGFPIRPEVIPGHLKVGWNIVRDLPIYVRPLKSRRLLKDHGFGLLAPIVDVALRASDLRDVGFAKAIRISVEQLLEHPGFDALVASASAGRSVVIERTREFFRWRLGAPEARYDVIVVEHRGSLQIAAITRIEELEGIPTLAILDIIAAAKPRGVSALHRGLLQHARSVGVDAIAAMLAVSAASRLGFKTRFVRAPRKFQLIVKTLADKSAYLNAAEKWEPMWIDSDDL